MIFFISSRVFDKIKGFWNKRKVKKYYTSNILNSEFELFDELINEYQYLGTKWSNNYSVSFNNEIKDILSILKDNKLSLEYLIKCISISLKKFEDKYLDVFKLEEIDWKSEYKKLIKKKQKIDLKNLHIKFAKHIMFKIEVLQQEQPKLYVKFERLMDGKRLPTLKKMMESYRVFISEIFPIIISSIEGGITLFPNKRGSIDYMIFDEASQIFLERGISLMNRGQKVIVAGDGKQLQPSNFFAKNLDDYDEEDDIDEFKASEYSSLLEFATTFFSKEMLNYHYSSENRELIEFSNKIFYEGKLLVCEKPYKKQKAIEVRNVDGKWINQRNEIEANTVVQEILNILDNRKNNETIGVVAFNKNQANLILEKLEKLNDPIVEWEMNGKSDVNKFLFVKNLEEVQGDERDIIIFSVSFARDSVTNRLKRNFGPINNRNGENRINVAVSRAIKKIIVVKSIKGHDFGYDISALKSEGAKVFADYINYVDHLQSCNLDNEVFQSIWSKYLIEYSDENPYQQMDSILEEEIYTQLKKHLNGERFEIIPQVKQSGFRIDLGIKDKTTGNFVLAIECDGHTYHSKPMDRARDIWRQSILESNGWKFERISSLQWWKGNQNKVIERVLKKIETLS
ncbi:AAA domain-containing protein [Spiroplasma endosymbiont of Sarcophaga carnaria]|uniref:AAA domain-containing protein n=1 Tax=Spiroplasma endosymbiont of Sarcophaga carnaria TaxID=3066303 RepID=UPI0030CC2399